MNEDFKVKFEELIREQLPTALGMELQGVLTDYERLRKQESELKSDNDKMRHEIATVREELRSHTDLNSKLAELDKKALDVLERERNLMVQELTVRLDAQSMYSAKVTEFMIGMSKNTTYRRTFSGDQAIPNDHYSHFVNHTAEITEE